jgi:S-DNA-T family DNA segregation ATPase FtsK/SpoIIIE
MESLRVAIGIIDLPSEQSQMPYFYDLEDAGNWGVAGGARSGKTTFLHTLAVALATKVDASDVQIYGLDFGGGGLLILEPLPHCGGIFRASESERLEQFVRKLTEEHRSRQMAFAEIGVANIGEQRSRADHGARLPYIVILLDRWELVSQEFPPESGSSVLSGLSRLIREASTTGIRFVLTGDRGLLADRVFSHLSHRLSFRLGDVNDYRQLDLQPKSISKDMAPGRAVRAGDAAEIQFATFFDASAESARDAIISLSTNVPSARPLDQLRVDILPERISAAAASTLPSSPLSDRETFEALCVGGDALARIGLSPSAHRPGILIAGPRRSGRSTAVLRLALEAIAEGMKIALFSESSRGTFDSLNDSSVQFLDADVLVNPMEYISSINAEPTLLIIDDSERFIRSAFDSAVVETLNKNSQFRVLMTGSPDELSNDLRGTASMCKRSQSGLILRPQTIVDGQLFGQRIERTLLGGPPGRGQLFLNGRQWRVQVINNEGV